MATVNFTISGVAAGFTNWTGSFTVGDVNTQVQSDPNVDIVITTNGDNYTFQSNNFQVYPDATLGHNYVTWRTQNTGGSQFPTAGKSLDIWSPDLYTAITGGAQWDELATYNLSTVKHTLVYNYDVPHAPYYSKGGTISFAVV